MRLPCLPRRNRAGQPARSRVRVLRSVGKSVVRFNRDDHAQMVFIGVFGAIALIVLLAFVLNNSANLHEKMRMQNAADAAAMAAAQEIARGMNIISDNNVAITEYLAQKTTSEVLYYVTIGMTIKHGIGLVGAVADLLTCWRALWGAAAQCAKAAQDVRNYYKALKFDIKILANGDYFLRQFPRKCENWIDKLQKWSKGMKTLSRMLALTEANQVAKANGANRGALAGWPEIPAKTGRSQDWVDPARWGSNWVSDEIGGRGYYHVYSNLKLSHSGDSPIYPCVYVGPVFMFSMMLYLQPWYPVNDGWAHFAIWGIAAFMLSSKASGMDPPLLLEDFDTAYHKCRIGAVAYPGPKSALAMSSRRDMGPFSRRLGGFEHPQTMGTMATAAAQVFNPASWDLFSQYWDAKLTRVKDLPLVTIEVPIGVGSIVPATRASGDTSKKGLYH